MATTDERRPHLEHHESVPRPDRPPLFSSVPHPPSLFSSSPFPSAPPPPLFDPSRSYENSPYGNFPPVRRMPYERVKNGQYYSSLSPSYYQSYPRYPTTLPSSSSRTGREEVSDVSTSHSSLPPVETHSHASSLSTTQDTPPTSSSNLKDERPSSQTSLHISPQIPSNSSPPPSPAMSTSSSSSSSVSSMPRDGPHENDERRRSSEAAPIPKHENFSLSADGRTPSMERTVFSPKSSSSVSNENSTPQIFKPSTSTPSPSPSSSSSSSGLSSSPSHFSSPNSYSSISSFLSPPKTPSRVRMRIGCHPETLSRDLEKMVNNKLCSDIQFVVEEKPFYAHKFILAVRAPKLFSFVCEHSKQTTRGKGDLCDSIVIPNVSYDLFEVVMQFIYTDSLDLTLDMALKVLVPASYFDLERLVTLLEAELIANHLCVDTAAYILHSADVANVASLRNTVMSFILKEFDSVTKTDGFRILSREIILEVLHRR